MYHYFGLRFSEKFRFWQAHESQEYWDEEWDDDSDGTGPTPSLADSNISRPPAHSMTSVDETSSGKFNFESDCSLSNAPNHRRLFSETSSDESQSNE